jgi:ABC-type multidrug transport system fused ATPase/permease subunit
MAESENQQFRTTSSKRFWRELWKILAPSHKQIKRLLVLIVVFRLAQLIAPYALKLIIDRLSDFSPEQIAPILLFILALFLSEQLTSVIAYFKDKKTFAILSGASCFAGIWGATW